MRFDSFVCVAGAVMPGVEVPAKDARANEAAEAVADLFGGMADEMFGVSRGRWNRPRLTADFDAELLKVLGEYYLADGIPPTLRKLAARLGVSIGAVANHIEVLANKGLVEPRGRRGFVPVFKGDAKFCPTCKRAIEQGAAIL